MKTPRLKFIIKVENTSGVLLGYWADREGLWANDWWSATSYDSIIDANRVAANLNATARIDGKEPVYLFVVVARQ